MLSASPTTSRARSAAPPRSHATRAPASTSDLLAADSTSSRRSAALPTRTTSQHGPIHLRKDDFPLLHSLLQSPEYLDAVAKDPDLARSSSARRAGASSSSGVRSSRAQQRPPKSGAGVADLWSKVPRAFGTASSVAGSFRAGTLRRQHPKQQPSECEAVEAVAAVEKVTDEAAAAARSAVRSLAAEPRSFTHSRTEPAAPLLLASRSLPDLPTTTFPPIPSSSPSPYPARTTQPRPLQPCPHPPPSRPSTAFASAVSGLKRVLSRSTRPSARSPRSTRSRSFGTESALSASTIFGGAQGGADVDERPRSTSGLSGLLGSREGDARPASLSAYSVAHASLDVPEPASTSYTSYGRRWEGSSAPSSPPRSRRSLSVRRAPAVSAAAGEDDDGSEKSVWSKWRRWVRERREAMRKQDGRTDPE